MSEAEPMTFLEKVNSSGVSKYMIVGVLVILIVNVLILNILALTNKNPAPSIGNLTGNTFTSNLSCPQACVDLISTSSPQSSSSAIKQSSPSPTPDSAITSTPIPSSTPTSTPAPALALKEVFIPLGSGFGNSGDWSTITGIGANIDLDNYGEVTSVFLEVTVRIPTGNQTVYVRLYNANSYQSVPNSDVSLSGGTPTILISKPISLSDGNVLYQIQMKTQLQYLTYIDQARIRIVLK